MQITTVKVYVQLQLQTELLTNHRNNFMFQHAEIDMYPARDQDITRQLLNAGNCSAMKSIFIFYFLNAKSGVVLLN